MKIKTHNPVTWVTVDKLVIGVVYISECGRYFMACDNTTASDANVYLVDLERGRIIGPDKQKIGFKLRRVEAELQVTL